MNDRKIKPAFQTRPYYIRDTVAIKDRYQSFLFIKHGASPVDLYVDCNDNLVMVFMKSETKELYEKYRRYELK